MSSPRIIMDVVFNGFHKRIFHSVEELAIAADMVGLRKSGPIGLPRQIKKWTVNKSPFKYKKSRDQFELRIHRFLIRLEGERDPLERFLNFAVEHLDPLATMRVREHTFHPLDRLYSFYHDRRVLKFVPSLIAKPDRNKIPVVADTLPNLPVI